MRKMKDSTEYKRVTIVDQEVATMSEAELRQLVLMIYLWRYGTV